MTHKSKTRKIKDRRIFWLRKIKKSLVKLGYISAEVGDAFQHKIRAPYNDNIKEKPQKGFGSCGKDYDP